MYWALKTWKEYILTFIAKNLLSPNDWRAFTDSVQHDIDIDKKNHYSDSTKIYLQTFAVDYSLLFWVFLLLLASLLLSASRLLLASHMLLDVASILILAAVTRAPSVAVISEGADVPADAAVRTC